MSLAFIGVLLALVVVGGIVILVPAFRRINHSDTPWWVKRILNRLDEIVATLSEAVQGWRDYTADLKAQRDAAVAALEAANTAAAAAAQALADFQADDAATDATQLAAQAQADADAVQAALDEVKTPPVEPPVVSQPVDGIPSEETPDPGVSDPAADPGVVAQ